MPLVVFRCPSELAVPLVRYPFSENYFEGLACPCVDWSVCCCNRNVKTPPFFVFVDESLCIALFIYFAAGDEDKVEAEDGDDDTANGKEHVSLVIDFVAISYHGPFFLLVGCEHEPGFDSSLYGDEVFAKY